MLSLFNFLLSFLLCLILIVYDLNTFIVQTLVSVSINYEVLSSHALVPRLSSFFPYCGLSYIGLITGSDVDRMTNLAVGGNLSSAKIYLLSYILIRCSSFFFFFPSLILFNFIFFVFSSTEDEDDYMSYLSYIKHGASLAG